MNQHEPPRHNEWATLLRRETGSSSASRWDDLTVYVQRLAPIAALLGGFFYILLRLPLTVFYQDFGVSPEEVGWDMTSVLATFALPVVATSIMAAVAVLPAVAEAKDPQSKKKPRWTRVRVIAVAITVLLVGYYAVIPISLAGTVSDGDYLRPSVDRLFPVTTPCVRPTWNDDSGDQLPADAALLGYGQGLTVLYDAESDATLRIPSGSLWLDDCA
jgi:amino acid transporter